MHVVSSDSTARTGAVQPSFHFHACMVARYTVHEWVTSFRGKIRYIAIIPERAVVMHKRYMNSS